MGGPTSQWQSVDVHHAKVLSKGRNDGDRGETLARALGRPVGEASGGRAVTRKTTQHRSKRARIAWCDEQSRIAQHLPLRVRV